MYNEKNELEITGFKIKNIMISLDECRRVKGVKVKFVGID